MLQLKQGTHALRRSLAIPIQIPLAKASALKGSVCLSVCGCALPLFQWPSVCWHGVAVGLRAPQKHQFFQATSSGHGPAEELQWRCSGPWCKHMDGNTTKQREKLNVLGTKKKWEPPPKNVNRISLYYMILSFPRFLWTNNPTQSISEDNNPTHIFTPYSECVLFTVCTSWKVRQSGRGFPTCHCHGAAPECVTPKCEPSADPPACCHPVRLRSGDWIPAHQQSRHRHTNSTASRDTDTDDKMQTVALF